MKGRFFQILIGIAALALAGAAAYFSVFGLSKLFAGAAMLVIIMASALEFGKIIAVSFIYRYWKKVGTGFKTYFTTGIIVLMVITSLGIYGFLSSAYQQTASIDAIQNSEIAVYELKKKRFDESRVFIINEKTELDKSVSEIDKSISVLRKGLSNNVIQYTDSTGQLITTTSSSTRRALQSQLKYAQEQRVDALNRKDNIGIRLESLTDSLGLYDRKIYELESSNETSNELGPLKYLSNLLQTPMNKIVNWFILLIIFVFDPMAIALIIAFNYIGIDIDKKKKYKNLDNSEKIRKFKKIHINEEKEIKPDKISKEDGIVHGDISETSESLPEEKANIIEEPIINEEKKTKNYLKDKYNYFFPKVKVDKQIKKEVKKELTFPGMQPNGSIKI